MFHLKMHIAFKVAKDNNVEDLANFITKLDTFLSGKSLDATIICSSDVQNLPPQIQKFC